MVLVVEIADRLSLPINFACHILDHIYMNLEQVTAKWHPEDARRPDLEEAPVFYPSEEVLIFP